VQRNLAQHAHVEGSKISVFAASCLAEAEAFGATFGVLLLEVVGAVGAVVALAALNVLLAEAGFVFLVADFESGSAEVTAAGCGSKNRQNLQRIFGISQ
jgi:hypothetical protein